MDLTSLFGQGPATSSNQPFGALALPASAGNNAPMNILPSVAQTSPDATQPVNAPQPGILNNSGDNAALSMAMKMIQPQQHALQGRSFNGARQ